jgi:hypothetical protein
LETPYATPKRAQHRRLFARWTGESRPARQFGDSREQSGLHEASPTVEQNETCDNPHPDVPCKQRQGNQAGNTPEPNHHSNHQAPRAANYKPKHRAQYLPTVERVNGQQIEDQKKVIYETNGTNELIQIRNSFA